MTDAAARARDLLGADARLKDVQVTDGPDGLKIAAACDPAWLATERETRAAQSRRSLLMQWQFIWDRSYQGEGARAPNFDVWVSGFTGEPIPDVEMRLWLDAGVAQMRSVPHGRVLDIGCGSGLVLEQLAPGGVSYEGIDVSAAAIGSLGAWAAGQPGLEHVRLAQGAAHDVASRQGEPVNLVVLNSVVQYFPDADYLTQVLEAVEPQVASGGSIFVGDVRASALLPLRARNAPAGTAATRELALDPAFFQALDLPRLSHVRFALKPGGIDPDLAGYRYDALLLLDRPQGEAAPVARSLDDALAGGEPAAAVLGLANRRLGAGEEPDDVVRKAGASGYAAQLRFTPGAQDGRFDVLLSRDDVEARWPAGESPDILSNDPLGAEVLEGLRRELHLAVAAEGVTVAQVEVAGS